MEALNKVKSLLEQAEAILVSNGDKDYAAKFIETARLILDYVIAEDDKTVSMENIELTVAEPDGTEGDMRT